MTGPIGTVIARRRDQSTGNPTISPRCGGEKSRPGRVDEPGFTCDAACRRGERSPRRARMVAAAAWVSPVVYGSRQHIQDTRGGPATGQSTVTACRFTGPGRILPRVRSDIHEEPPVKIGARRARDLPNIHPASPATARRNERVCGCPHSHRRRRGAPCRTPGCNLMTPFDRWRFHGWASPDRSRISPPIVDEFAPDEHPSRLPCRTAIRPRPPAPRCSQGGCRPDAGPRPSKPKSSGPSVMTRSGRRSPWWPRPIIWCG